LNNLILLLAQVSFLINGYLSIDEYSKRVNAMRQIHPDKENLWQQLTASSSFRYWSQGHFPKLSFYNFIMAIIA
jgi:ABC-type transport system involved in cytochrome c biogenesis permease subunit